MKCLREINKKEKEILWCVSVDLFEEKRETLDSFDGVKLSFILRDCTTHGSGTFPVKLENVDTWVILSGLLGKIVGQE